MRTILYFLALAFGAAVWAEDKKEEKVDAKQLVGKWEPKAPRGDRKEVIEFTKDGKFLHTAVDKDKKEQKIEGSYTVDGNKLAVKMKANDKEQTVTRTISKLTDEELVSKSEQGKEDTLVRIKDK
jgi:uncharacterized protein (TIGR03066 family)